MPPCRPASEPPGSDLWRQEVAGVLQVLELVVHHEAIGQAAGLCALAAVGGPLPQGLGGEALPGEGHAERAVHEHLQLRVEAAVVHLRTDPGHVFEAELAGEHRRVAAQVRGLGDPGNAVQSGRGWHGDALRGGSEDNPGARRVQAGPNVWQMAGGPLGRGLLWGGVQPPPPPRVGAEVLRAPKAPKKVFGLNWLAPKAPEKLFDCLKARKKIWPNL